MSHKKIVAEEKICEIRCRIVRPVRSRCGLAAACVTLTDRLAFSRQHSFDKHVQSSQMIRARYSLRVLLVVVTLVAIGCWLFVRSREFQRRADFHAEESMVVRWNAVSEYAETLWQPHEKAEREQIHQGGVDLSEYHLQLSKKYRRAAKYPWLPVEADPPPPP